jgi:PAS domain S-box-containing protein
MSSPLPPLPPAAFLAAIIEGSDDAIVTKDLHGTVTSWNASAERIFGYPATEIVGRSILVLLPPDRRDEERHILARLQRGERVQQFETRRVRKDGREIDVSLTISPIRGPDGTIVGASKIARDITELKTARERLQRHASELEERVRVRTLRLEESVAELEAFSYSLSHDMRGPLRAIHSLTEIVLADHGPRVPDAVPLLQRIASAASRLDRLIRDVLDFTRLSQTEIALQPVDLDAVVAPLLRERPEFQRPQAEITVLSPLLSVVGHPASLSQCLVNLLENAVKFIAPGARPIIQVFTETHGDRVRVAVRDNGIGVPPEHQQRLFNLFERVPGAQDYRGTGVGLAIVRKAAARMRGTVGLESSPGLGSTFWIELPAAP